MAVILTLMLFGFGERLLAGTGIPPWLAFVIAAVFIGAFFIPEIVFTNVTINFSGFILPIAIAVLFTAMIGFKLSLIKTILGMFCVGAVIFGIRFSCVDLGENGVLVATLVAGFLSGLVAFFITDSAKGVLASVFGGAVIGDLAFSLLDFYVYGADSIYLGVRGNYNTIVIGAVFGLIVFALMNAIIRTFQSRRETKRLKNSEQAEDVKIDESEAQKFDSFFDDEII